MKKILIALVLSTVHYTNHAQQLPKTMPDKSWGQTAQDYTIATANATLSTIGLFGAFAGCVLVKNGTGDKPIPPATFSSFISFTIKTLLTLGATNIALTKMGLESTNGCIITQAGIVPALNYDSNKCLFTFLAAGFLANLHAELQARGINNPISTFIANNPVTNALIDNTVVKTLRWALSLGTISFDENGSPKVGFNCSYKKIS